MAGDFNLLQAWRAVFMSSLAPLEKLVALALLDHWSRSRDTFPSVDRLAKWTSLCRRSVLRSLAGLETKGAVAVTRSHGRANRYELGPLMGVTSAPQAPVPDGHQCPTGTTPVPDSHPTSAPQAPEVILVRNPLKEPTKRARADARRKPKGAVVAVVDPKEAAEHKSLTALYFSSYESARGTKPPFDNRDGKAVKDLLAKCGAETAAAAIRGAFADSFWKDKVTIRGIADEPAKFVGLRANGSNGRGARQPNGGDWKPVMES
jgi:Helix-turn-helix domain